MYPQSLPSPTRAALGLVAAASVAALLSVACSSTTVVQAQPPVEEDAGAEASTPDGLSADGERPACTGTSGASTATPDPRGDAAGALDPTARRFVLFGGDVAVPICPNVPTAKFVGDTWVLDVACGEWRKLDAQGPSARSRLASTTDTTRGRGIFFGGRYRQGTSGAYTLYNDVWAFDFAAETWAQLPTTGTGPSARANATAVYDAEGDRVIVFGGNSSTNGLSFKPEADAFALDLKTNAWSPVGANGTKPRGRLFHSMAIDATTRTAYVFSGGDENAFLGPFFKDVFALDLATDTWREVAATGDTPLGRINGAATFDSAQKRLLVFGGHDDGQVGNQNDLYALDVSVTPAVWSRVEGGDTFNKPSAGQCDFAPDFTNVDKNRPDRRGAFAFGVRKDGRGLVLFGGKTDCGLAADAWWMAAGSAKFTPVNQSPVGLSCVRVSTTCKGLCG